MCREYEPWVDLCTFEAVDTKHVNHPEVAVTMLHTEKTFFVSWQNPRSTDKSTRFVVASGSLRVSHQTLEAAYGRFVYEVRKRIEHHQREALFLRKLLGEVIHE